MGSPPSRLEELDSLLTPQKKRNPLVLVGRNLPGFCFSCRSTGLSWMLYWPGSTLKQLKYTLGFMLGKESVIFAAWVTVLFSLIEM
jgi:hypothetical protein